MLMVPKNALNIRFKYGEKSDKEMKKVIAIDKEIIGIQVDPGQETSDIDTSNNSWPKKRGNIRI